MHGDGTNSVLCLNFLLFRERHDPSLPLSRVFIVLDVPILPIPDNSQYLVECSVDSRSIMLMKIYTSGSIRQSTSVKIIGSDSSYSPELPSV